MQNTIDGFFIFLVLEVPAGDSTVALVAYYSL